ncbi:DNA-formamidopyrimidine glycosylase family protein [Rurimicrobium arvi]|uniref:Endonuclease n=1 Tax=Rurimicrobium arvi TaxID=2049916 RepID=A0ABP8MIN6_9BACT
MPEGPSIVILKELVQQFANKKVIAVSGNAKLDIDRAKDQKVIAFRSWGKHFLICFKGWAFRVHLLMFGSYRINEEKDTQPRLSLIFPNGSLNLYSCSVKIIEGDLSDTYDWSADIMSDEWDPKAAVKKLREHKEMLLCDALLDQEIFSGSGNIIKNEVLFRERLHPANEAGWLKPKQLSSLVKAVHDYAFDFLKWKKEYTLKSHWQIHTRKECPRCKLPAHKEYMGKTHRRTFFCTNCQLLHQP